MAEDAKKDPHVDYKPPDLAKFVIEAPLYTTHKMRVEVFSAGFHESTNLPKNMPTFSALLFSDVPLDAYCPWCREPSIFRRVSPQTGMQAEYFRQLVAGNTVHEFMVYTCSRNPKHEFSAAFRIVPQELPTGVPNQARWVFATKMGMMPSLADLQRGLADRIVKAIGKKGAAEFKRGIGLAAHGVGIGAFVYLRRIFEDLVDAVARPALESGEISEEEYWKSRMDEKVGLLKNYLPPFMVEHKQFYGIVSKALHELTEAECIEYFPVIRDGIEIMGGQKADRLEHEEKIKSAGASIQSISAKLKGGDPKKVADRH